MTREEYRISQKELDRRYAAVQSAMKRKGLDAVILQTHSEIFDMYQRYLTDLRAIPDPYSMMLLVPAEGEMYFLVQGQRLDPDVPLPADFGRRHIGKYAFTTACMAFHYTDEIPARLAAEEIRKRGYRKIGFTGMGLIGFAAGRYFLEHLPDVEFSDFTDDFDRLIAVKSDEEVKLLLKAVDTHCVMAEAIPALVVPGRTIREIKSDLYALSQNLRCELPHTIYMNAGPGGRFAVPGLEGDPDYVIRDGDAVSYLLEMAAEGGMYAELARTLLLYEPSQEEADIYSEYLEGEAWLAAHIRPGMTCSEVVELNDSWFGKHGFGICTRMAGHGQGYGMMERPAFRKDDDMVLEENMFLALHPGGSGGTKKTFSVCNNYLLEKDGAKLLTWYPAELKILGGAGRAFR